MHSVIIGQCDQIIEFLSLFISDDTIENKYKLTRSFMFSLRQKDPKPIHLSTDGYGIQLLFNLDNCIQRKILLFLEQMLQLSSQGREVLCTLQTQN